MSLAAKVLCLITQLLITLSGTITLLIIELYHSVEPLIKKFLILITCRVKTRFVFKRCSSDILTCNFFYVNLYFFKFLLTCCYKKILVQNCMINRFEYGVQIRSIHANFSFTQKNIASKKQVENNIFLNEAIVDKPFLVKKYVVSCGFALLKLRRKCNGVYPASFLMDSLVKTKFLAREFSSMAEIESERFKRSILEDLKGEKWPTDCIKKCKAINDYVQSMQNQILLCKREQRLEFIAAHVFDIKNRIFSIDKVFNKSKSSSYGQVGYSDLTLKSHKFILLKQTKLTSLSELPPCKVVMVEIPKANGGKRSLGISMPVDKVLQQMFLNFLDVLVEEELKPEVFAYRKGRDARMAVASVYAKLNRAKYIKQMCLCSVDLEKCFDNFFHNQIIEQYPFPERYGFLLSRWLTANLIDKNRDFKNLGQVNRGVPQGSILGPSIGNLLLSNAFPENILKERGKDRQKVWADIFSYADDIILTANNQAIFFRCAVALIFPVMYFSQIHVNLFSLKKVTSLPEVAANQSGGKASGDGGLRLSKSMSRLPETILSKVTMRNLIRYAGASLPYWPSLNNDQVAMWLELCVQGPNQENTSTALQTEDYIAQGPKLKRLKNRKNLRTTGFNLRESLLSKGKRSVHSTSSVKEGTQTNKSFVGFRRLLTTIIRSINLDERVLTTKLKQMVEKCKNKDGRYGNLIQIIGVFSTINFAYLMVKSNSDIFAKGISDETLDGMNLKTLQKISKDTLSGAIKLSPVRRVLIPKPGKSVLRPLGVSSPREKIVQKAIDLVLTAIFEEIFLDCSHGPRPNRSCHSALKHLQLKIENASTYSWVIEGDIKGCFDNIPHSMILKGLRRRVDCPATINLIKRILSAGYILDEDLKKFGRKRVQVHKSNVGTLRVSF